MTLHWTPNARADLRAIQTYIAQDSPEHALNMIDRLINRSEQIVDFPLTGRVVPEYEQEEVREVIEKPYRIIYRIRTDRIDVLSVMHGARLLRDLPKL